MQYEHNLLAACLKQMVFPWMFDEFSALAPLKEAAVILAAKEDWPVLYDRQALNANRVSICF